MSQTIINDIPPRTQAVATGGQTVYSVTWTADVASDVIVYSRAAGVDANDDTQILSYPSQYSVAFIGALRQVEVTLVTPSTLGDIVTLTRMTPADRENLYSNTNFTPSMLNNDFGILTLVDQQNQLVNQLVGPRYNYSAVIVPLVDTILPILPASHVWVKNSDDDEIITAEFPEDGAASKIDTYVTMTDETANEPNSFPLSLVAQGFMVNLPGTTNIVGRTLTGTANQISISNPTGLAGNPVFSIPNNPVMPGTAGMGIPQGTTAQRVTPVSGIGLRYNTDIEAVEYWDGSAWIQLDDQDLSVYLLLAGGTMSGIINMDGNSITNLPAPSAANDAARKAYVDLFLPLAGGTMLGNINMGGFKATNAANPTSDQDYATKFYVDQNSLNGTSVYAASAASLGTVTQSGAGAGATLTNAGVQAAFALDGVNPPVGSNVLIKNTATGMAAANEGIYTVTNAGSGATNWVLTRATSYDTPTEINNTGLIVVQNGSTLAGTTWYNTTSIVTVDTTAFNYEQFGAIYAMKGANADITSMSGLTGYLQAPLGIKDSNGNEVLGFSGVPSAVNYVSITNQATGNGATIASVGTDSTIGLNFLSKGGGFFSLTDTTSPAILRFYETGSVNYVALQSPAVLSGDLTFTLPAADGANAALWSNGSGVFSLGTFANANITSMTGLTGVLEAPTQINDANSNEMLVFAAHASAVNHIGIQSNQTGSSPIVQALGSDTNVLLTLRGQGNQGAAVQGTQTNDDAPTLYVGEFISSVIAGGSAVTFPSGTNTDLTSISLTAGDWDVWGNITFNSLGTTPTQVFGWFNTVSATTPDSSLYINVPATGAASMGLIPPARRFSLSATTTIYITGAVINSSGNGSASGGIYARRVR